VGGLGTEYWAERTAASRRPVHPPYRGQREADAVVIGGGLTGATAAYLFAAAGLRVVLLEAGRLASGSTAGSLGVIVPQPDASYPAVEAAVGRRAARTAWEIARRSSLDLMSLLKRLNIKCDLAPAAVVVGATRENDVPSLKREQAFRKAAGLDAPWITGAAATKQTGADLLGALRLREGATFDPVRATLGLASAAAARGAVIAEKSMVTRTRFTRKYADVVLRTGSIRTRAVFVATGGPGSLFAQLRRHVREQEGYVVVTEPLSAAMKRETGGRAAVITEASANPYWWRWLGDDRALFAGALGSAPGVRQHEKVLKSRSSELMYQLSVRYPVISGLPAKWGWSIPVISTGDGLPWVGPHRNYPFHFFAMAFGWHGDAFAWHAAKAAVRYFEGSATREDDALGFLR
jgi:glycine/D-amino acid oxidase-like deaminating enzyme